MMDARMKPAFAGYIASFLLLYLGRSFPAFAAAMLLYATGEASRTGTHKAMIMSYLGMRGWMHLKSRYYGRTRSWSQLGAALDALLIASYPAALDGNSANADSGSAIARLRGTARDLRRAARDPRLAITVVNASLLGGFYKAAKDFLQPMIQALAISLPLFAGLDVQRRSAVLVGIVYALLYVATSVAARSAAAVLERLGPLSRALNLELFAGLGVTFGAGVAHAAGLPGPAVTLFMLLYVLQNLRRPLSVTYMSDAVSERVQATALSVESQVQSLIGALCAIAIGAVAEAAGGAVGVGLAVVAGTALLAFPLYHLRTRV